MLNTRWKVFRGDSTRRRDLMFTVVKPSVIQLRGSTKVSVFLASNDAEQACDFRITGSYHDGACAVSLGDSGYHDGGPDRRLRRKQSRGECVAMRPDSAHGRVFVSPPRQV